MFVAHCFKQEIEHGVSHRVGQTGRSVLACAKVFNKVPKVTHQDKAVKLCLRDALLQCQSYCAGRPGYRVINTVRSCVWQIDVWECRDAAVGAGDWTAAQPTNYKWLFRRNYTITLFSAINTKTKLNYI